MTDLWQYAISSAEQALRGDLSARTRAAERAAALRDDPRPLDRPTVVQDIARLTALLDALDLHDVSHDLLEHLVSRIMWDPRGLTLDLSARNQLAVVLADRGHVAAAAGLLAVMGRFGERRVDRTAAAGAYANLAALRFRLGDVQGAVTAAQRAETRLEPLGGDATDPEDQDARRPREGRESPHPRPGLPPRRYILDGGNPAVNRAARRPTEAVPPDLGAQDSRGSTPADSSTPPAPGDTLAHLGIRLLAASVLTAAARRENRHAEADRCLDDLEVIVRRLVGLLGSGHPKSLSALVTLASAEFESATAAGARDRMERAADVLAVAAQRAAATMGAHHPQAIAALVSVATAEGEAARLTEDSRRLDGARSLLAAAEQRAAVHQRGTAPTTHERDTTRTPPSVQLPPPTTDPPRQPEQRRPRDSSAPLRISVLGPVRIWRGSEELSTGSAKQRALLAALALREGRMVTVAELIDVLWSEEPPSQAVAVVRTYASRVRRVLGPDMLVSRSGGYALQTTPNAIDLSLARELAAKAERLREIGEARRAGELLDRALALWDGEPLAGVPGPFAETHRTRLAEWRLHLLEIRLELDLDLGSHAEVVSELTALTAAHPLRERLRELLMLALYRSGRQSEAIAVYDDTQRLLADAVGIEPGPGLRRLQERILHTDPALAAPRERPVTPQTDLRPSQLPSTVSDFTGRAAFMSELDTVLTDEPGAVAAISALAGIGGVGKTTLAVHAAHRARRSFPDGQLYVDLRGVGPDAALPEAVLGAFLRSLGTPESAIPDALDDRAALYRSLLDGRRVLVLLDNARDAEQVRPLLPGAPGCATLITSRVRMVDLAGAHLVDLDVMSPEEALQFFTRIVGEERITPEREAALDVVTACGFLPLAIRIAGSRLAARRTWTVSVLAAKLSDERRRLDELQAGDLAVRATFAMGYRQLVPGQARAFRLLGLADGPDISLAAAAAMLDQPVQDAERLLETLVDAGFLESAGPGRYRYHDLVRLYARSCAAEDEQAPDERESALARLLDFYLATAAEAYAVEHPGDRSVEHLAATRYHDAEFSYLDDARRWLNTEASCVLSCVRQLAHGTLLRPAIDLLWSAKDLAGSVHHRLYQATAAEAKQAAHEARDAQAMGRACAALTAVHLTAGNLREADEEAQRTLALAMAVDDPVTIAWAPYDRGVIAIQESRHAEADLRLREALSRFRADDNLFGVASALCQLSHVESSLGNARSAVALAEEAIDRLGDETDTLALAECRYALGLALAGTGQTIGALEQLDQALVIFQDGGQALGEGTVHFRRAEILLAARRHAEAAVEAEQALAVFHRVGGDRRRADVLVVLGDVLDGGGESARARSCWTEALAVAERVPGPEGAELRGRLETRLHGHAPSHTSW